MKQKLFITLSFFLYLLQPSYSQQETYTITKAPFSSDLYDEFSPVYYRNGLVFCSNRSSTASVYSDSQNRSPVKINYIDTTGNVKWKDSKLFSKQLTSRLNDGPVTFNSGGDTIYFSRNLKVDGKLSELSGIRNNIGIFSAVLSDGDWGRIRELRFNNEWYNIITPWLSSDGKRLFFASDKPGGFGGFDLYYSIWNNGFWENPVNLGPVINTTGNEGYPFINPAGELFFSSDGHPGLGGKDIFFSRFSGTDWLPPVRLDAPLNSEYDDFGIITDNLISEGYFSSTRNKTIDIFHFKTNLPQIFYTNVQKENHYCFTFSDSGTIVIDTLILKYVWDFGDGNKASGSVVNHCYAGPGTYKVRLDLFDKATGKLFFSKLSYTLELKDFEQPYINSPVAAVTGEQVAFDGLSSFMPGYKVVSYSWDFGNGSRLQGERVNYSFKNRGEYNINLGLKVQSLATGAVHNTGITKKIVIFTGSNDRDSFIAAENKMQNQYSDIRKSENAVITPVYSAEDDFKQVVLFRVELTSSTARLGTSSPALRNVPAKYSVREISDLKTGSFRYIADEQMSLMYAYPAYRELSGPGFKDLRVTLDIVEDPAEKELVLLKKNYGLLADNYFDASNRLTTTAYLFLDQIVILMNRNPDIRIVVGVHTDNLGLAANNLSLSNTRAQLLVNYLVNRGINSGRLVAKGYGGTRLIASGSSERERRINRRVDLVIVR